MSKTKFQVLVEQYEQRLNEGAFPSLSNIHPPTGGSTQTPAGSGVDAALDQDPTVLAAKQKVIQSINGGQAPVATAQTGAVVPGVATAQPGTEMDPQVADAVNNHPDVIAAKQRAAAAVLQNKKPANTITNP